MVNTTAKKFWKTWTVTHLLKVRQNSGCIVDNDGWQFLYQKGHDNMLVGRGEEILFNIVIDSTGARFGGLSCVRLWCQLSRLNMTSYVLVVSWNACFIKWRENKMNTWISFLYILRTNSGFHSTMGVWYSTCFHKHVKKWLYSTVVPLVMMICNRKALKHYSITHL